MHVICYTVTALLSEKNTKSCETGGDREAKKMERHGEICFCVYVHVNKKNKQQKNSGDSSGYADKGKGSMHFFAVILKCP